MYVRFRLNNTTTKHLRIKHLQNHKTEIIAPEADWCITNAAQNLTIRLDQ